MVKYPPMSKRECNIQNVPKANSCQSCRTIQGNEKNAYYSNSIEYLLDECKRIEFLLQIGIKRLIRKKNCTNNLPNIFISDEEVNALINDSAEGNGEEPILGVEELKNQYLKLTEDIVEKRSNSIRNNTFLSLVVLQNTFRLSPFELDVLILSLLPEFHKKYEKIYGYLQDDITLKRPAVGLISDILSASEESRMRIFRYFLQENNLFRYNILKLIDTEENTGISSKTLKIEDRILNYLLEINNPDPSIAPFTTLKIPEAEFDRDILSSDKKDNLLKIMQNHLEMKTGGKKLFVNLGGSYGSGRRLIAEALCKKAKIFLLIVDSAEIIKTNLPFDMIIKKIFIEGILQPAAIYFENIEAIFLEDEKTEGFKRLFFKIADELSWITFFSGEYSRLLKERVLNNNIFINVDLTIHDNLNRKMIWKGLLEKEVIDLSETELSALANKFKFTKGQIIDSISSAKNIAQCNNGYGKKLTIESIYEGCRIQSNNKLSTLAQKVRSNYTWRDIILPEDKLMQLHEITNYIKYKDIVYDVWGFNKKLSLCRGLNILFSGPSGTGKTMAAGVIANDLKLDMYKIDLSQVVSKYIGETEKNLSRIFKEAESSNAILFFDEADALFGKRSEIKDAHDRYANIETGYLLQKMEEYEGIVILATNLRNNMDEAFARRMHFIIEFPFPDEKHRELIWRTVFPNDAPIAKDIDYKFLSEKLKITGGNIKNIALTSAFYAADEYATIGMSHILCAAKREYQKIGKSFLKTDFEPYYELIEGR